MTQPIERPFETVFVRRKVVAKALVEGSRRTSLPEYSIWAGIIARCTNANLKAYRRYGGRGIKVCDRWVQDFENFYADMGPRPSAKHSIDRIDNDGNYEPSNCRWATPREQILNRSSAHNIWTDQHYETLRRMYAGYYTIPEIAAALDRSEATVRVHLHKENIHREGFLTRLAGKNPDLRHLLHAGDREGFIQAITQRKALRVRKAESQKRAAFRKIVGRTEEILRTSENRNAKMKMMREAGMSLTQIGNQFSLTRERVRQIEEAGFPGDEGHASGDRRKISKTNPEIRRKKIDRLCRAWNAASREARIAFLTAAPNFLFSPIVADLVDLQGQASTTPEAAA